MVVENAAIAILLGRVGGCQKVPILDQLSRNQWRHLQIFHLQISECAASIDQSRLTRAFTHLHDTFDVVFLCTLGAQEGGALLCEHYFPVYCKIKTL